MHAFSRTGDPEWAVEVGQWPTQIAGSASGRVLVVAGRPGGSVLVLDPATLPEVRRVELAGAAFPHGVTLDPAGEIAYLTWEGRVAWQRSPSRRARSSGGARSGSSPREVA